MKKLAFVWFWGIGAFWAIGCGDRSQQLTDEQMKRLLWDLSRAEAFQTYYLNKDTTTNKEKIADTLYGKIFALHKVSSEAFFASLQEYKKDPVRFKILMDSVNAYGNRLREQGFLEANDTTKTKKQLQPTNE
ncbi:MAG TPA: DUF4296 domain-containing protein [Phnomibacter sp.]|nr:DUF4296 domain-containing protein [Phnomibacter sp.]